MTTTKPLRVHFPLWFRWTPWVGAALMLACAVFVLYFEWLMSLITTRPFITTRSLVPLIQANLCLACLLTIGPTEMSDEYIGKTLPFGRFEIRWDEVERIEMMGNIVFHGPGKKLVIPTSKLWAGRDKAAMLELFEAQVAARGIPVKRTFKADFQMSRGTRVRESFEAGEG